jgi:alanine racemase
MAPDDAVDELVSRGVRLSLYLDDDATRLPQLAGARPIRAHVYLDTGMSRMGVPYHRAMPWLERVAGSGAFQLEGTFMGFTEETDFDREQLARFRRVAADASTKGVDMGRLHAASSNAVFHLPEAHLDMVRPGIALFGGYPSRPDEERAIAELEPAASLRCRVVRVERLRPGDSVSYGRGYVAARPTWIATLPAGHVDGYPRGAVDGARVAIGGATCPVIGAVSASHVIVEVGEEPTVSVGDVATLMGPDHPDVHPNEVARRSGSSVYDRFMHLNPSLPRYVVD